MTPFERILSRFRDLPIRRKLRLVSLLTTASALLLAGLAIIVTDAVLFYNYLERDLQTFVAIIGDNSTGALAFDDQKTAGELLHALQARSHVENACLFHTDGTLLARYQRTGFAGACTAETRFGVRRSGATLIASQLVSLDNKRVGQLVIRYDLGEIRDRLILYGFAVLAALILSCLLTLGFSASLRGLISKPILELAGVANKVSSSRDYSIRARVRSADELGTLAGALNQMMEGIQQRDSELQKALEEQVQTAERLAQLNAQLNRSNDELARSNSDLERFAFMASHDLQEPLRIVTSYSQLLVAEGNAGGIAAATVGHILAGTRRMRLLLSDLLSYLEITHADEPPLEIVDVNGVVARVRETLHARIEETRAEVTADRLPAIRAHSNRIESLLQNLIENAIKYRSERDPRVHIHYRQSETCLVFGVADNGIGIEPAYQDKIFVAFQRLHGKEVPGTGVGLAICQRIVERYGGRIWVDSEFGKGSTLWFSFPTSMSASEAESRG